MAVSEKLVETLINYAKAETRSECEQEARNYLDISSDQDNMSCVVVLRGETRLALRNAIRARRWRAGTLHTIVLALYSCLRASYFVLAVPMKASMQ